MADVSDVMMMRRDGTASDACERRKWKWKERTGRTEDVSEKGEDYSAGEAEGGRGKRERDGERKVSGARPG
jgi:hypothetical protein